VVEMVMTVALGRDVVMDREVSAHGMSPEWSAASLRT
jgi:hypothetical protein